MKKNSSVENLSRAFLKERLKDPEYRDFYEQEMLRKNLGAAVAKVRKQKKLSKTEFAQRVGIPEKAVDRIERGEYGRFTLKLLQQIGRATGTQLQVDFV